MAMDRDTGYYVTRTSRAFVRVAETALRPVGLGIAHVPVLVCLADEEPLTQVEIAQRIHVEQPTAAALLQRMDRAGLIDRSPDPDDGRATQIRLSTHARDTLPEALALLTGVDSAATAALSSTEIEQLHSLLRRVQEALMSAIAQERPPRTSSSAGRGSLARTRPRRK